MRGPGRVAWPGRIHLLGHVQAGDLAVPRASGQGPCGAVTFAPGSRQQFRRFQPLPDRLSRQLRQLLDIGVIKRITGTYRYYLTKAGRAATAAAERLKQATIVPAMI